MNERYPNLGAQVYSGGELARFVNVYVGGEDARTLRGLETPVNESTTVILLPAMAGGSGEMVDRQFTSPRLGACARHIAPASPGAKANRPCHRSSQPRCLAQTLPAADANYRPTI